MPRVVDSRKLIFGKSLNGWLSDHGCTFSGIAVYGGNEPMPFEDKPYEIIFNLSSREGFNQRQVEAVLETFAPLGFSGQLFIKYQCGEDVMLVPAMSSAEQRATALTFGNFPADSVVGFTLHASEKDLQRLTFGQVPNIGEVIRTAMTMGDKGALKKQAAATDVDLQFRAESGVPANASSSASASGRRVLPRQKNVDHHDAPPSLSSNADAGGTVRDVDDREVK